MLKTWLAFGICAAALLAGTDASAKPRRHHAAPPPPVTPQGPMPYVPGGQTTPAPATTAPASASLSNDTDAQVLMLVRSSLTALQQANQTGNYDVLYALGSSEFQKANTPQKLGDAFAALKPYNLISVEVLEPQFTQGPGLDKDGRLFMAGYFVNDGYRITFQLMFTKEDDRWKMLGISAGLQADTPAKAN